MKSHFRRHIVKPKLLKDFPLFMAGCESICSDSGCGHGPDSHWVKPNAETAEYTAAINFVESTLQKLQGKIVKDFIPEMLAMDCYEDIEPVCPVIELVYLGVNDSPELILQKAGLSDYEIWLVEHIFDSFFQGELHQRFTS
jgi:hypothetical protein